MNRFYAALAGGVVVWGMVGPNAALADAIDGHWCDPAGKHLTITHREIITPGGARLEGDYTRHAFTYVAPANEPGAGSSVNFILLGETTMRATIGNEPPVTWKRCETVS